MRIAMLGQKGIPSRSGGIERHVELLAHGLASRGAQVTVYGRASYGANAQTWSHESGGTVTQILTSGVKTKHLDAITHGMTALWHALRHGTDVVHIHGTGTALLAPLVRIFAPSIKIVVTFHCLDWEHAKWGRFARFALRFGERIMSLFAHRVIVVSEELQSYALDVYGAQSTLIRHPFFAGHAETTLDTQALSDVGVDPHSYLLFVSRLVAHKQPDVLIRAYDRARRVAPQRFRHLPLIIVGASAWTDEYVQSLQSLAAQTPGVTLVGEKHGATLRALQQYAYAHVFPTRSEGSSFAVLEAAAMNGAVIATDLRANREILGSSAFYCQPTETSLAEALVAIAAVDASERSTRAAQVRAAIATSFAQDDGVDATLRVYRELVYRTSYLVTPSSA